MASNVEIANRALQKLGAKRITELTEDSRNARAVNSAFETLKKAELRRHPWNFAVSRAQIPVLSTAPLFGKARYFQLPSDCLRVLPWDPEDNLNDLDWQIEGRKIATDDVSPLNLRYIYDVTDPNEMDVLFREALAMRLAYELCEEITQSNTKKVEAQSAYSEAIAEAKRTNAIERIALDPPADVWETVRS